jgi:Txe/YoeB family toxin of toxin-antitoxin system
LVKSPESKKRGVQWTIVYTRQAVKDSKKLKRAGLKSDAEKLLDVLRQNPFQSPPFEKLVGDLSGAYSRRINIQHRIVYQVLSELKIVKILRMWTYYE